MIYNAKYSLSRSTALNKGELPRSFFFSFFFLFFGGWLGVGVS